MHKTCILNKNISFKLFTTNGIKDFDSKVVSHKIKLLIFGYYKLVEGSDSKNLLKYFERSLEVLCSKFKEKNSSQLICFMIIIKLKIKGYPPAKLK